MKIHKVETVKRYQVTFTPGETHKLMAHAKWSRMLVDQQTARRNRYAAATLTKSQISEICDVLGINAREFFALHEARLA